jgi:hypothetical protein
MQKVVGRLDQAARGGTSLYKILVTGFLIYELLKFRYTKWRK